MAYDARYNQTSSRLTRQSSFDDGDDGHLMGRPRRTSGRDDGQQVAEEQYYDPNYRQGTSAGGDAQSDERYLPPIPGTMASNGASGYGAASQDTSGGYPPTTGSPYQQQQLQQQSPLYNGAQRTASTHQPYNPATYHPPQRNATISYAPQYGQTYNPGAYNSGAYPTYKPSVTQYANRPTYNPQYSQTPASPTYRPPYSPGFPSASSGTYAASQTQAVPPTPTLPYNPAYTATTTAYGASTYSTYNNPSTQPGYSNTPFAQNATNQMFAGGQYASHSVSPPADSIPAPPNYVDYGRQSSVDSGHTLGSMGASPPPPPPPAHQYALSGTHNIPRRPLPARPEELDDDSDATLNEQLEEEMNSMFDNVEEAVRGLGSGLGNIHLTDDERRMSRNSPHRSNSVAVDPLFAGGLSPGKNGALNGQGSPGYSDISDAEAEAGLVAMQLADQQDRMGYGRALPPVPQQEMTFELSGSDSDYRGADLSFYAGGYPDAASGLYNAHSRQHSQDEYSELPSASIPNPAQYGGIPDDNALHPFPNTYAAAQVDDWGSGLVAANARRLSFDEGDEDLELTSHPVDSDDEYEFPEMFYHPATSIYNRPLPSLPTELPGSTPPPPSQSQYSAPLTADALSQNTINRLPVPTVPRSTSLNSHAAPSSQAHPHPMRSKTDAEIRKRDNYRSPVSSIYSTDTYGDQTLTPQSIVTVHDLPTIPQAKRRKFVPEKLSTRDFKRCEAPWALSHIAAWIKEMTDGEQDLKEQAVAEGIVKLFTHYVPTMNVADAETLAARVVTEMIEEQVLVREEEWVKFGSGEISGVMYQITGHGCYSPKVHDSEFSGRCYAHHCARTLKKIKVGSYYEGTPIKKEDWITYWKLKKEDYEKVDKKEIARQNNLHEIVQTEEEYMDQLKTLKEVYQDQIAASNPPIIKPSKLPNFVKEVFGKAEAVRKINEEYLLPQLQYRQREQGPWIVGFSDIFREWVRKARTVYVDYAANFPRADMLMRREVDRNLLFRSFLDHCRQDPRTKRLDWVTFLKGPITRLQRYSLLLVTVLKHTIVDSDEKRNLAAAIEEIKRITHECDARVDESTRKVTLLELGTKLILRPGMDVNLRLDELGRQIIYKGDLQRMGTNRFAWVDTHAILFDHYLVLAKKTVQKDTNGGVKLERYDVSRKPIPMDLLILESTNDDPIVKNTANRLGLSAPVPVRGQSEGRLRNNSGSGPGPGTLSHTSSGVSTLSAPVPNGRSATATSLDQRDDRVVYPFKIKHLGRPFKTEESTYTLFAPTAQVRQEWCEKIIKAKEQHAASLHAQNAEPFRIRVLADCAFATETISHMPKPPVIRGTPLNRAIQEVEERYASLPRPNPICRSTVNCATSFTNHFQKQMIAVGTDNGVFVTESDNPRGWRRAFGIPKVTQIAVLEEFSVFLILTDKALVAFHLDVICPPTSGPTSDPTKTRPPQKLSGARDIGFFTTGRMKERTLVFYKKREAMSSTFKVLEPVLQKATEKRSRWGRKGSTDFFREFDEFYIPADCYGLNLFHSSMAIHTAKGFEVITLDKKLPMSIPDLKQPHVATIAQRVAHQKPLGMFRLTASEFILCYEECAVYCNKHGEVSRAVVMYFVGRARAAAVSGHYLLLFDADFVEVRNAENGRLRQVIAARDCRLLDDGGNVGVEGVMERGGVGKGGAAGAGGRRIKVAMAHPEVDGRQLVVELVVNEGQRE